MLRLEPSNDQVSLKLKHFEQLALVRFSTKLMLNHLPCLRKDINNSASKHSSCEDLHELTLFEAVFCDSLVWKRLLEQTFDF